MQLNYENVRKLVSGDLSDMLIRLGIMALLAVMCARIFAPFAALMLQALILAVALYPVHQRIARWFGGRQGRAATLVVLAGLLLVGMPIVMLGSSFAGEIHNVHTVFQNNEITIRQPDPAVAEWPLVGKKIYAAWSLAADDLPALLEKNRPQLANFSKHLLLIAASTVGAALKFLGSLVIAFGGHGGDRCGIYPGDIAGDRFYLGGCSGCRHIDSSRPAVRHCAITYRCCFPARDRLPVVGWRFHHRQRDVHHLPAGCQRC
jgi:hypothetical protein